jgi:muconolactone delta-isomerase
MQFLAITRRRVDDFTEAQFAEHLPAEGARARELYAAGVVREIHSRGDIPGAVLLVEAADLAEAKAAVGSLPFAQLEMMDVDYVPLKPYRGFAGG